MKRFTPFRCNVCGRNTSFPHEEMSRELWSCVHCGSSVRSRSIIHALSVELFNRSLAIADFPVKPAILGIGLSDWNGYADQLAKKLGYTNTYYHKEPLLDITHIDSSQFGLFDFIISADVFEHVPPPVSVAFQNARRLLKPGGVMVLTVPYVDGQTREHFPGIRQFSIMERDGERVLHGQGSEGQVKEFRNIKFHGGAGSTLEMRLFGKHSLLSEFEEAGFDSIYVHSEVVEEFGIYWNPYDAERAPYRPLLFGADTPPWAGRVGPTMALNRECAEPTVAKAVSKGADGARGFVDA